MRILRAAILVAFFELAVACSGGGGSSSPVEAGAATAPQPVEAFPPGVPALPGLDGYEIRASNVSAPLALADESVDAEWADETKELILVEIANAMVPPIDPVAVECRTTWCGVVIELPRDLDSSLRWVIRDRLQRLFDVRTSSSYGIGRPDGSQWIAIYLEIRRFA